MNSKVFATSTESFPKRNEFKGFLHSVLYGGTVQKPQENKGFRGIQFQKYYEFRCFDAFWRKLIDLELFGKNFYSSGGQEKLSKKIS